MLGKEEVSGSNPEVGSTFYNPDAYVGLCRDSATLLILVGTGGGIALAARTGLDELVGDFLIDARARVSKRTLEGNYAYRLREVFLPWCEANEIREPSQLSNRVLARFASDLLEHGGRRGELRPGSVVSYVQTVRRFVNWAAREGELGALRVPAPRLGRRVVPVLSLGEQERLEDAAENDRDRLLVALLGRLGLRAGEVVRLEAKSLLESAQAGFLHVHGKGANERRVPLLPARLHREYRRQARLHPSGPVFRGRRVLDGERRGLTVSGVEQLVRELGQRALGRRVYPHLLRHSAITRMLAEGMNAYQVRAIVGNFTALDAYAHLTAEDAYSALAGILAK